MSGLGLFTTVFCCGVCDAPAQAWTETWPDGVRLRYEFDHAEWCPDAEGDQP